MNHIEFAELWPGTLGKIEFVSPKPLLPSQTTAFLYFAGLPRTFSISCNEVVTFETLPSAEHLSKTWAERMRGDWSMPIDWARFWRLGDITYTQAAAWLCLEEVSGRVFAIDIEVDGPVYPINESLISLASSMFHWVRWFSDTGGNIGSIDKLRSSFAHDVTFKAGEIDSFWGMLMNEECESMKGPCTITYT